MQNKVELLGTYGGDEAHALSAWTSTSRDLTEDKRARVGALLAKLAKDGHETPFEKSSLHFLVTCETASHIHLLKHRIGVSVNAESARYKELKGDNAYVPEDWPLHWQEELELYTRSSFEAYHRCVAELVGRGFTRKRAKESARYFLPYANQLTLDVMFNFRSFVHFVRLRMEEHAQDEIRLITANMLELVARSGNFNLSLEAFGL